jgi:hypothetical protein
MFGTLASVSSDAWYIIGNHLFAIDIVRLWLTGSKAIQFKLSAGLKKFCVCHNGPKPLSIDEYARFISLFPQINSVELGNHANIEWSFAFWPINWTLLPRMLVSLSLRFPHCVDALLSTEPCSILFPSLKKLDLRDCAEKFQVKSMEKLFQLPPSMEHLFLCSQSPRTYNSAWVAKLPSGLKTFYVENSTITGVKEIEWPQALETIVLHLSDNVIFDVKRLPKTITDLTLNFDDLPENCHELFSSMPPNLTRLAGGWFSIAPTEVLLLPRSLTCLEFAIGSRDSMIMTKDDYDKMFQVISSWKSLIGLYLPKSLGMLCDVTTLRNLESLDTRNSLPSYPPNLTELSLGSSDEMLVLDNLPRSLVHFVLRSSPLVLIGEWPSKLTSITLGKVQLSSGDTQVLPHTLRKLRLGGGFLDDEAFSLVPNVSHLSFDPGYSRIPEEEEEASLTMRPLPDSVTTLELHGSGFKGWRDSLKSKVNLRSFSLSTRTNELADSLYDMPPNLTRLIYFVKSTIYDSHLTRLPKKLRHLVIYSEAVAQVTPAAIATLPHSLTLLSLPPFDERLLTGPIAFPPYLSYGRSGGVSLTSYGLNNSTCRLLGTFKLDGNKAAAASTSE